MRGGVAHIHEKVPDACARKEHIAWNHMTVSTVLQEHDADERDATANVPALARPGKVKMCSLERLHDNNNALWDNCTNSLVVP